VVGEYRKGEDESSTAPEAARKLEEKTGWICACKRGKKISCESFNLEK